MLNGFERPESSEEPPVSPPEVLGGSIQENEVSHEFADGIMPIRKWEQEQFGGDPEEIIVETEEELPDEARKAYNRKHESETYH